MRRGDLVTIVTSGDYGKPRPAVIIQADIYDRHPSVTVLPLTSVLQDAPLLRITVNPGGTTGLRTPSQVMVDKAVTVPRAKIGNRIGQLDRSTQADVDGALAAFLGMHDAGWS